MAQMNNLLISWNFDNITGSDNNGAFIVSDVSNTYSGTADSFSINSLNFLLKEDIKTSKLIFVDTLDGSETIQALEEDDPKINNIQKPSSLVLLLENSMYQLISDEMLKIFSTVDAYSFKFTEPFEKYKDSYDKLDQSRIEFFSKIVEKPNLEKYIEFYKWIDSSLGYMLEQLKPENSNNSIGLKNTIESHILERNKYVNQLPLTIESENVYSAIVPIIKNESLLGSTRSVNKKKSEVVYVSDEILDVASTQNKLNINYKKNYEFIQTAGKTINYRSKNGYKSIFKTNFTVPDGNSEFNREDPYEYSIYNGANLKYEEQKNLLAVSSSEEYTRYPPYIIRSEPDADDEYADVVMNYQRIPDERIQFYKYTNIIVDINKDTYENSQDIVEPPVQFCLPLYYNLQVATGLQEIVTYSPYSSIIDDFSGRNKLKYNGLLQKIYHKSFLSFSQDTFFNNTKALLENSLIDPFFLIRPEIIYPRTDLIGLARVRTKTRYEEELGYFQQFFSDPNNANKTWLNSNKIYPWTDNSYNNETSTIRMFWRDSLQERIRTRGVDIKSSGYKYITGSFNCYLYPNIEQNIYMGTVFTYDPNIKNSIWSMDSSVQYDLNEADNKVTVDNDVAEIYGDLAPYSHFYSSRLYLAGKDNIEGLRLQPKPQFIHNLFLDRNCITGTSAEQELQFIFNTSYQRGLDCNIKAFFDTYEDFRSDLRHKSQNMSIVPEYITSKYENLIDNNNVEIALEY